MALHSSGGLDIPSTKGHMQHHILRPFSGPKAQVARKCWGPGTSWAKIMQRTNLDLKSSWSIIFHIQENARKANMVSSVFHSVNYVFSHMYGLTSYFYSLGLSFFTMHMSVRVVDDTCSRKFLLLMPLSSGQGPLTGVLLFRCPGYFCFVFTASA